MNTTPMPGAGRNLMAALVLTATLALWEHPVAAGSGLESFVLAVGGESTYPTFGVPQPVYTNFGGVGPIIPGNPAGLAASNIEGDYQHTTQPGSPLLSTFSFTSGNWVSTWSSSNRYSGAAAANARYGHITTTAGGTYAGWGGSFTVVGSEAFAIATEQLTITSPTVATGVVGYVRFSVTAEGAMNTAGESGTTGINAFYKMGSGGASLLVRASVSPSLGSDFYPYSGPGRDGFSITNTAINGQGTFDTIYLPFTFGAPVDFKLGLLSYNTPAKFVAGNVRFALQITGIEVFGVTNFVITSGSGTAYSTNGVQTVVSATPSILSAGFHAGGFRTLVTGLDPTQSYLLKRSDNLGDNFATTVDGPRYPTNNLTPNTDYFTDPAPGGSHGFYRIQLVP